MKTTKPNPVTYNTNYQLMSLAQHLLPLMPEAILDRISAAVTKRADIADEHAQHLHVDRYDIAQDWRMTISTAIHQKIAK